MSERHPAVDDLLIDRYVADQCSPLERHLVEQWAASDPAHQKRLRHALFMFRHGGQSFIAHDARSAWQSWLARGGFDALEAQPSQLAQTSGRSLAYRRWPKMSSTQRWGALAACLVVVAGLGLFAVSQPRTPTGQFIAGLRYSTGAAERRTIDLADGTQLVLAPDSRLAIARDYGRRSRAVELDGEAFFAVVHNADRAFSVRTRQGVVRDVGTSFDLKAYPEDGQARVAVVEGEVAIARTGCLPNLPTSNCAVAAKLGDVATFGGADITVSHPTDIYHYFSWMQSRLVYHGAPLAAVVHDMERVFSVQITIADSTMGRRLITGDFDDASIDQILLEITRTLGVQFVHRGRAFVISQRSAPSTGEGEASPPPLSTAFGTRP